MLRRFMRGWPGTLSAVLMWALMASGQEAKPSPPLGFAPSSRAAQEKAEAFALAVPTPGHAHNWLRILTEDPHVAGTPADRKTALFVRDKLREWGWDVEIAEYEVLLNYPDWLSDGPVQFGARLQLLRPTQQMLPLIERPVGSDKDSASPDAFPAFHGFAISGSAQGQVVYANYARPEDFESLERMGVEVEGKIVLARYGEIFRGLKVRNAQKRKAAGILIYSDPADDGYARGDIYPAGPFRPGSAIQRGSVQFLSLGPGDPSTPFGPSVRGAKRLPIHPWNGFTLDTEFEVLGGGSVAKPITVEGWEKETGLKRDDYFATIPSLPIGYDAARPILKALAGPNVPSGWQGGLPFAYHVGPGPGEVRFSTRMDYRLRTIWNVIGTIQGEVEPERRVMIGNHRDAWVYGAVDPGSGTATTLEMCRALGAAVRRGWKPRRTLVYASWDAEEYGLVGSTEWAEEHAKEVDEKAVLMLNVDSAVAGAELDVDGIPSLRDLLLDALGAVNDPRSGVSLRQAWVEKRRQQWASQAPIDLAAPGATRFSPRMDPLGSGSDYTAFVDHLGVPALDIGFGGRYGVYHSVYDDLAWMEKFGDPEFLTHATAARLFTAIAMRAAGSDVLPLTFVPYAEAIHDEVDDLRRLVERKARAALPEHGRPPLSFAGLPDLIQVVERFRVQAEAVDRATAALTRRDGTPVDRLKRVNDALTRVERAFLLAGGLPGRPWFRHAVYAPGLTTGYSSWTLPGVRQAILENDPALLAAQLPALVGRIDKAADALKAAEREALEAAVESRISRR